MSARHILVAVAWPYAQGSLHLGHIAGAYLPPDIFARYHRLAGNQVLMVSGSDVHGTPITVKADQEGVSPEEIVDRYHPEFLGYWDALGISFDLFTTTGTDVHIRVAQDFFTRLLDNGYLYPKTTDQFFDEERSQFLPDRYIEGTCPHCGYPNARGDQCDNCGRTLDPSDLIDPRSKLTGSTPVLRQTEHYYWRLSAFNEQLEAWLSTRHGWRPHVLNFALGMVREGLHDRSFTRDLDWGIPIPTDAIGPGKSIYVWWEAVMGYLSAPQEWAALRGEPDAWKEWWTDPEAESYYFVGKDNIPFHAVYWPALIMGHGDLDLPTNVPANQYVTFGGHKASKSRGVGRSIGWYLDRLEPDALRFALASVLPEQNDTDLSDDEIVRRVNDELVATWGNLVNRVLSLTVRNFDGLVPSPGELAEEDRQLLTDVDSALGEEARHIEAVELRAGLRTAMEAAGLANTYLTATEPWKLAGSDRDRAATVLWTALQAIAGIRVAFSPYLPFSTDTLGALLGAGPVAAWARSEIPAGTPLGEPDPLFIKLEIDVLDDEENPA
ncbi:MAG TPA: methionine--tRNA ligase [Acidimicrobiia bacterium]|nr:methionine--tRNA ligase [Acidimicrobiia bacterium]